ncbi:hypothetical protein ACO0LC_09965 [Undibacterium sp. JH2W]|uniref:hypothetical protein n=1 Tax=Undibacterium sp. JH2W TaxID=3413037 RepID=UPI003BF156A1
MAHWPFQLAAALILLALVILTQISPLKTVDGAGFLYVMALFLWPVLASSFALIVAGVNRLKDKDASDEKKLIGVGILLSGILGAAFVLLPTFTNMFDVFRAMLRAI